MAAQSFHRSKSSLGDWFRRIRAKLGTKAAVTAAAHKLARILYAMVKHRTPFDPVRLGSGEAASFSTIEGVRAIFSSDGGVTASKRSVCET